jgi:hypothetical protein
MSNLLESNQFPAGYSRLRYRYTKVRQTLYMWQIFKPF